MLRHRKDPVAQLEIIAPYRTGMIAKDCTAPQFQERAAGAPAFGIGVPNAEVMIPFGTGKVNFAGMFRKLKSAGFSGPLMIEGVPIGATLQATTNSARRNLEFLERVMVGV